MSLSEVHIDFVASSTPHIYVLAFYSHFLFFFMLFLSSSFDSLILVCLVQVWGLEMGLIRGVMPSSGIFPLLS